MCVSAGMSQRLLWPSEPRSSAAAVAAPIGGLFTTLPRPRGGNPAPLLTHSRTQAHTFVSMCTPSTRVYMLERPPPPTLFFPFFFRMTQIDTSAHGRGAALLPNHMRSGAFKQPRLTLDVQVLIDSTWRSLTAGEASVKRWGEKKQKKKNKSGAAVRQEAARASAGVA